MPLTKSGKKIEKRFEKEYGKRGKNVFYAYIKSHPTRVKSWHK